MIKIKTIGIVIRPFTENNIKFIGSRLDLFQVFKRYSVNIIAIPIDIDFKKIKNILKYCDGIVLSGGENLIQNDFLLVKYLYEQNIPTLGICLGMQSMAEYFNNQIEINIDNHASQDEYVHKIKINKESLLYKILKKEEIMVNSRHHSAIPYTSMLVSARSIDNIIEAVEIPNHKFFLGVEWHPESLNDNNSYRIFQYFIDIL